MNVSGSLPNSPGIYCIVNKTRNRIYVGKTKSLSKRLSVHLHQLRNSEHGILRLQVDFAAGDDLWFMTLEHIERGVDSLRLSFLEQWWIDHIPPQFELYNSKLRVVSPSRDTYQAVLHKLLQLLQSSGSKG